MTDQTPLVKANGYCKYDNSSLEYEGVLIFIGGIARCGYIVYNNICFYNANLM